MKTFEKNITSIQNAINNNKKLVFIKKNKKIYFFLDFLIREGFLLSYHTVSKTIIISLKYTNNGINLIQKFNLISKISRIILYKKAQNFPNNNLLCYLINTIKGYSKNTTYVRKKKRMQSGKFVLTII